MSDPGALPRQGNAGHEQYVRFDLQLWAVDPFPRRKRWNGEPMASLEANHALHEAVAAFQAAVRDAGLEVGHSGYGVVAKSMERASV